MRYKNDDGWYLYIIYESPIVLAVLHIDDVLTIVTNLLFGKYIDVRKDWPVVLMRVPQRMSLAADILLFILDRGVVQDCKKEGSYKNKSIKLSCPDMSIKKTKKNHFILILLIKKKSSYFNSTNHITEQIKYIGSQQRPLLWPQGNDSCPLSALIH